MTGRFTGGQGHLNKWTTNAGHLSRGIGGLTVREMTSSSPRVLVVDDEPMIREVVARYLEREGFVVDTASDGREVGSLMESRTPDLVVLDLMLPGIDGLELLSTLRRRHDLPVIILTAKGEEMDRVLGLEMGADDYVAKPFSPRELAARVRSVLRRSRSEPGDARIRFDGLVIDRGTREVVLGDDAVDLTAREFDLLAFMASSPRQVFSRAQLLHHVWDSSPEWQDPSTVTVHVGRIRQKIERDAASKRWIETVFGVGYRFVP